MRRRKRPIQSRRTYKDSTADENLQAGRTGSSCQKIEQSYFNESQPLVPEELHELARHINSRSIDREEDFVKFDYHLCRLSHARSLVDLCLGELLAAFRKADGKACGEMGYSNIGDFSDEHLSFSGRLASELILNFERLQALPLMREAYIKGDIVKSALRLLLRVATKENEAALLSEIDGLSVRQIEALVKERSNTVKVCGDKINMAGGDAEGGVPEKADAADGSTADMAGQAAAGDSIADMPGQTAVVAPGGASETALTMAVMPGEGSNIALSETGAVDSAESMTSQEELTTEELTSEEIPSEEADREEGSGVVMKFNVPRTLALTWDFALEHFKENDRTNGPLYVFVEVLVSSFLDSTADLAASKEPVSSTGQERAGEPEYHTEPEPDTEADAGADSEACSGACINLEDGTGAGYEEVPASVGGREVPLLYTDAIWNCFPTEGEIRARERDSRLNAAETDGCKPEGAGDEYPDPQNEERLKQIREELALQPFVVKLPEEYSQIPDDSHALAQKIIRVASMRQSIDYHTGWFLKAIRDRYLFRIMEFSKIEDYAKARINISSSTTFRLIRLVSYFKNHPAVEKAFLRRKITREQAYLIASLEYGRHEKIWLDFAMSRPARELRDEVNRMMRIKEYDYFAPHSYALLPGFRYITDDRYDALPDDMKDILRTGTWYKGPGSDWPLAADDEHYLDKGFADKITEESDLTGLSKCAADLGREMDLEESSRLSKCAADPGENSDQTESSRLSKCAADPGESSDPIESSQLSKCAADTQTGACQCREREQQQSDEALETVRELCTLPDRHRPAMTLLLDVLESLDRQNDCNAQTGSASAAASGQTSAAASGQTSAAASGQTSPRPEPAMSIRFFLPRGLYGIWNEAVRRYVSLISPDDGVELLVNNEGVENFIALLLTQYLLAEKAHHKAAHNNKVLERDGYKCQVPGCSNRRNIHAHHLEFRSHGGCNATSNLLSLCASHHLWILHILHSLKIEGTAPDDLTFTFGPSSSPEGQPFMIYRSGRKVLAPAPEKPVSF
ncbi:MAG: hypothetical protein AB2L14_37755 [Candidatus Xenobiia bacterium LiM19]